MQSNITHPRVHIVTQWKSKLLVWLFMCQMHLPNRKIAQMCRVFFEELRLD